MAHPFGTDTLRLFELTLPGPERGAYLAAFRRGKGFQNLFANTLEELEALVLEYDRAGYEVFHLVATVKEARNDPRGTPEGEKRFGRTKPNIAFLRCLRLDIDVGPDKPYNSREEAQRALARFVRETGLPPPIIVYSGPYGLHVYWTLDRDLTPEEWQPYADGLHVLCQKHGLKGDPMRTRDRTGVLRPLGTHNRKPDGKRPSSNGILTASK
jgi:hypothetical protein